MKISLSHLTEQHRQEMPEQFAEEIFVHTGSNNTEGTSWIAPLTKHFLECSN